MLQVLLRGVALGPVAGVYAPAFVERGTTHYSALAGQGYELLSPGFTPRPLLSAWINPADEKSAPVEPPVAGVYAPAFVERPMSGYLEGRRRPACCRRGLRPGLC